MAMTSRENSDGSSCGLALGDAVAHGGTDLRGRSFRRPDPARVAFVGAMGGETCRCMTMPMLGGHRRQLDALNQLRVLGGEAVGEMAPTEPGAPRTIASRRPCGRSSGSRAVADRSVISPGRGHGSSSRDASRTPSLQFHRRSRRRPECPHPEVPSGVVFVPWRPSGAVLVPSAPSGAILFTSAAVRSN